jgi:hypothetical protein
MNIENVKLNENITLKPIPPKYYIVQFVKLISYHTLKMNAEFYKTCDDCRHKKRVQGRKH